MGQINSQGQITMLTEPQRLLVDALRSGEYKQGNGILCRNDKYCCLGVACEVYIKHVDPNYPRRIDPFSNGISYGPTGEQFGLPEEVREWLGFTTKSANYSPIVLIDSLIDDNDGGKNFIQIADIIESKPKGLFIEESKSKK